MWKEWIEYALMAFGLAVLLTAMGISVWFVWQLARVFEMALGG